MEITKKCSICNKKLRFDNKDGYCTNCRSIKKCHGCNSKISKNNQTGYCVKCYRKTPEWRKKRTIEGGLKRKLNFSLIPKIIDTYINSVLSVKEVGKQFGVSGSRIQQILFKNGITRKDKKIKGVKITLNYCNCGVRIVPNGIRCHSCAFKKGKKEGKYKKFISNWEKDRKLAEKTRKKMRKTHKILWQDPSHQSKMKKAFGIKPNKPELKLQKLLDLTLPNEYKYVGDFQVWFGGKNPDFININGHKKLIELYGDFWHKNDDPQDRIDHFKEYGFDTLVIWDSELQSNPKEVATRIKEFTY